jgi:DNA-binding MarR family transcriptional regulator
VDLNELDRLLVLSGLEHPCDVDLLVFLHRHPMALLTSEQVAVFVGYDLAQVARSLDLLVKAGLLRRSMNPTHVARMYYFRRDPGLGWVEALLRVASSAEGRREIVRRLRPEERPTGNPGSSPGSPARPSRAKLEGANHA